MNSSINAQKTKSNVEKYFNLIESINFFSCTLVIIFGLISNLATIYLIKSRPSSSKFGRSFSTYRRRFTLSSISSSDIYILSLVLSDSLFLLAHLIEDIVPTMNKTSIWLQFVNKSNLICKLVIFVRNTARLSSSYFIVLFAYERFSCISSPLKRLKFHNRKSLIISIFLASCLLNSYTFIINGLRSTESHESSANESFECDVLVQFKFIYKYAIIVYTSFGIILPIILVCIFNIYIARVLLKRKNRLIKNFTDKALSDSSTSTQFNNNKTSSFNDINDPINTNSSKSTFIKINSIEFRIKPNCTRKNQKTFLKSKGCQAMSRFNKKNSNNIANESYFNLHKNNLYQFSGIAQRLKHSGRATIILIFLSAFFVCLNFPYIISWCIFFIPYQSGLLNNQDQILFRYSFVLLTEIFHMTNYSVNLILCCMASKKFRLKFKDKFLKFNSLANFFRKR